jgi:IclR family transcriptional regulator, acetate operon repressor
MGLSKNGMSQETLPIQSLDRGLVILEAVANSTAPVSLSELTKVLGIDRSSVYRLANTLKRRGFLAYPAGRKDYILGPTLWRLSHRYDWGTMLIRVSHDHLKQLASLTNETAHLAVREARQALFIDHAVANHVIAVSGQTGESVPLYCTAHGKALLADFDSQQLVALFGDGPLRAYTKHTISTLPQLARVCAQIRAQGFSSDDGEMQEGVRCVAAPIRTDSGAVVGSIGISAPAIRFPKDRYPVCGEQVRAVAAEISARFKVQAREA